MVRRFAVTPGLVSALLAAALVACSSGGETREGTGRDSQEIRPMERKIVGLGAPYEADRGLAGRTSELAASQKARREAAWQAVARVLRPVAIAEKLEKLDGGAAAQLPAFRTWYGKDDFTRAFDGALKAMSPEDKAARRPLRDDEVTAALTANAASRGEASDDDYAERLRLLIDAPAVDGLGANQRVTYSPGTVTHLMKNYAHTQGCLSARTDDPAPSPTSFAPCLGEEFPVDAAVVKTSWNRADFNGKLRTHDTSAETLAKRRSGELDDGGWGNGQGEASPGTSDVYTIRLSDGASFRLTGMHLMTKELREWLWITVWWSAEPNTDFGADRPESITKLGGPWSHYKMCVVTSYEEHDMDPRGGFEGSLGDALAAAHGGKGAPTWCSNPYIEKGAHNAQTNCVGCHQHAGTEQRSETILADETKFPLSGRTKLRQSFLTDYLWSVGPSPEHLSHVIEQQLQ
ncbi:hypothetical protein LVJ94_25685 [Pendulispora rubella]|uniref:Lipoprotein n=1 Tax=Pendulispora rubella TaxID=2741070 RepID=A0ABZ2LLG1_9BACT